MQIVLFSPALPFRSRVGKRVDVECQSCGIRLEHARSLDGDTSIVQAFSRPLSRALYPEPRPDLVVVDFHMRTERDRLQIKLSRAD